MIASPMKDPVMPQHRIVLIPSPLAGASVARRRAVDGVRTPMDSACR
jgi:hypothetical protein